MSMRKHGLILLCLMMFGALPFSALAVEDPPGSHRDWGLSWNIRAGGAGGGYGDFLQKGTAWDMDIFKQRGDWRYGAGLTFSSLSYRSPYDASGQPEWAHFETYGYASRIFRNDESFRPYLQGRFAIARVHPRSTHDPQDTLVSQRAGGRPETRREPDRRRQRHRLECHSGRRVRFDEDRRRRPLRLCQFLHYREIQAAGLPGQSTRRPRRYRHRRRSTARASARRGVRCHSTRPRARTVPPPTPRRSIRRASSKMRGA